LVLEALLNTLERNEKPSVMKRSTAYVQKFEADKIRYKVELEQREKKAQKSSSLGRSTGSSKQKLKMMIYFSGQQVHFSIKKIIKEKLLEEKNRISTWKKTRFTQSNEKDRPEGTI